MERLAMWKAWAFSFALLAYSGAAQDAALTDAKVQVYLSPNYGGPDCLDAVNPLNADCYPA